ncbi:MAG: efflux RND transporter permease subunit, partial [Phycisphaerae bacterium]|nr:efflux RND transporter permease subunit [Phycisphaerae bacterium]
MLITNAAIKNRTTVAVLILFIICAGIWSYLSLPRETFPEVSIPNILVSTTYESASPEVVEKFVTMKLEEELSGIKGLKEMRSKSAEGLSLITLEFYPNVVIEDALQYVRDRVNRAEAELPDTEERKEPIIKEIDVAEFPIMMINISGTISPVRLKSIADRLEEELEKIPGVLECDVIGALDREIRVEFDPDRMVAYELTIPEIMEVVPSQNVNVSAGGLETPGMKFNVRVPAEFGDPDEVQMLPLAVRDGHLIHLTDIARIRDTFKDRQTYARLDGREAITVALKKRTGADIIPIVKKARIVVEQFRLHAPKGVAFEITLDQSDHIRMMLSDLENNILTGFILVVGVLVLFMGWRTSIIVALAIPMSMLISFLVIDAIGYTLNMMILVGLIMALGMLVDNAIVIVENIYRHMQMGHDREQAAIMGTKEVGWPVITSTATTLAAFGPMMFWPGVMGSFMRIVPITLTITLLCSLFVAMVISPTVCSVASGGARKRQGKGHHPFIKGYRHVLSWALTHKFLTLVTACLLLVGMFVVYGMFNHGQELFPQLDPNRGVISIRAPQGTSIHQSDALTREIERRIQPYRDEYELKYVISNVGSAGGSETMFGAIGGPYFSSITLLFEDYEDRKKLSADAIASIRRSLADIPGAEIKVEKEREGPPTG